MTAIVLLPGMDGSGAFFADFAAALQARTLVVSYPPDIPLGYAELEDFVRRALPADEPYILVGESFAGPLAISLASSALPALKALVLVCTFAACPVPWLSRTVRALIASLPFWRTPIRLTSSILLGRFDTPALRSQLQSAMRAVAPTVWRTRLREVLTVDVTSRLTRLAVPVLCLRASDDRVVQAAASEAIVRNVPNVRVVQIEGPHFLLQARPAQAAAALRTFAQQCGIEL